MNTAHTLSIPIIDEVRNDVVTVSLKGNAVGTPVLVEWWSRHQLTDNQKIALCLVHRAPVSIILRNMTFLNENIFVEHIKNAVGFPYVVVPGDFLAHARKEGLRFGTFYMHKRRQGDVYQVVHFSDTKEKVVLKGNDVYWAKTRYNN